jgi:peptide chain release factor subunit 1
VCVITAPEGRRAGVELLAKRHHRAVAERLGEKARRHEFDIVAVGGHEHELPEFLDHLATTVWELVAGTFAVHSREDDLGRIRRSTEQVVPRYEEAEEQRLVAETLERSAAGGRAVVGLRDSACGRVPPPR